MHFSKQAQKKENKKTPTELLCCSYIVLLLKYYSIKIIKLHLWVMMGPIYKNAILKSYWMSHNVETVGFSSK